MMIDVESVLTPDDRMKNTGPRFRPSTVARFISGSGYLAGTYPDGVTTVEGVPVEATVRVLLRSTDPALDGLIMAETRSRQDGTWLIEGLNPALKYDVVGRKNGFNDVIMANVSPYSSEYIQLDGGFTVVKPERNALDGRVTVTGGTAPYTVDVVAGAAPAGIAFSYFYGAVEAAGTTEEWGDFEFTLRVTDVNGVWAETQVELESVDGQWDKVVTLLHFDTYSTHDETGREWTASGLAEIDHSQAILGGGCLRLTPTPDRSYLNSTGSDLAFGVEDFTLEGFFKTPSLGREAALWDFRPNRTQGNHILVSTRTNGGMYVYINNVYVIDITSQVLVPNAWHHVALVRESGQLVLYLDGISTGSATNSPSLHSTRCKLGGNNNTSAGETIYDWYGLIDEVRITKGVARYTEDFTPPKAPF